MYFFYHIALVWSDNFNLYIKRYNQIKFLIKLTLLLLLTQILPSFNRCFNFWVTECH